LTSTWSFAFDLTGLRSTQKPNDVLLRARTVLVSAVGVTVTIPVEPTIALLQELWSV